MALQYSVTHRTNAIGTLTADVGSAGVCKIWSGAMPASCVTPDSGTLLAQFTEAGAFGSSLTGVYTVTSPPATTGLAAGTAGYFRWYPSAPSTTNAVVQGNVYQSSTLVTSALTAVNGNILTFAAVSGLVVGQTVSGVGILPNTTIIATSGTTVTLSLSSTAGVASAATITFGGDMTMSNTVIAVSQVVTFSSQTITAFGA